MKLTHLVLIGLLASSSSSLIAEDNPISQMMDSAKDMMKSGSDTAKETLKSASDTAKDVVDTAKESAESAKDTGKEIVDSAKEATTSLQESGKELVDKGKDVVEDTKDFRWTKTAITDIQKGDPKKGETLAKEAKCSKCHGDTGISDEDDTPSIAGQISAYSYKQLHDYKEKLRDDRDMFKKVKKLSNQDMIDISAWYATQKPEVMAGDKKGKNIPVLANKGDKKRFLIACDTCHDDEAMKRGFQTPIIEGQKPEHFIETMTAFKEGDRSNDHYKLMQSIASKLTEAEITELAAYYATAPMKDE
jgi:cytochrome c553